MEVLEDISVIVSILAIVGGWITLILNKRFWIQSIYKGKKDAYLQYDLKQIYKSPITFSRSNGSFEHHEIEILNTSKNQEKSILDLIAKFKFENMTISQVDEGTRLDYEINKENDGDVFCFKKDYLNSDTSIEFKFHCTVIETNRVAKIKAIEVEGKGISAIEKPFSGERPLVVRPLAFMLIGFGLGLLFSFLL